MNAFFQWICRWFPTRKKPIESKSVKVSAKLPATPIDKAHQEIELTCHQIEKSIEGIRSYIRCDKESAEAQLLNCKQLITHLDSMIKLQ